MTEIARETGFDPTDGYDYIEFARGEGWAPVPGWGRDGWDLGDWPLVIVLVRHDAARDRWGMRIRTEGDLDTRWYATQADLIAGIDEWAHWWWRHQGCDEVRLAPDLRFNPRYSGPFSWARLERERDDAPLLRPSESRNKTLGDLVAEGRALAPPPDR